MAIKWHRIKKTKEKKWIYQEWQAYSIYDKALYSLLVYDDRAYGYGWRVWYGKTHSRRRGYYFSFKTRTEACGWVKTLKESFH